MMSPRAIAFLVAASAFLAIHPATAAAGTADTIRSAQPVASAARALLARYAKCVDLGDAGRCSQLFTEDGSLFYYKGREAIAARLAQDIGSTTHIVSNVVVLPYAPEKAKLTSEMTVVRKDRAGAWRDRTLYRYTDMIVHVGDAWLFSSREPVTIAFERNPALNKIGKSAVAGEDERFENQARSLIATYAECIELHRPPACIAKLFVPDGSIDRTRGVDAIEAMIGNIPVADPPVAEDDSNIILHKEAANRGTAVTDAMFYHKGATADMVWTARDKYFDEFVLADGAWRFGHREIIPSGR